MLAGDGDGVHMAVLYATMLGFAHELLVEAEARREFLELVQRPPEFTAEGIRRAVARVLRDTDIRCKDDTFDITTYGIKGERNQRLRPLLEPFRHRTSGRAVTCATSGCCLLDCAR